MGNSPEKTDKTLLLGVWEQLSTEYKTDEEEDDMIVVWDLFTLFLTGFQAFSLSKMSRMITRQRKQGGSVLTKVMYIKELHVWLSNGLSYSTPALKNGR